MFSNQAVNTFSKTVTKSLLACLVVFLAAGSGTAIAQKGPIKIGFVDIERILRDAKPAKAATRKLESEFNARDKELQAMAKKLKETGERFERDSAVMSERDRRRTQREFADDEKDFQRRQREFREDLSQRRNEELSQVIEKANLAIKQIAERENYDIIVQEAVVTSKRIDITEKIIKALDK
ncbi:MAG: OmpH family outer membrane protein [Burkholderiaceae bacterium]